jgi:hypothetical protein
VEAARAGEQGRGFAVVAAEPADAVRMFKADAPQANMQAALHGKALRLPCRH